MIETTRQGSTFHIAFVFALIGLQSSAVAMHDPVTGRWLTRDPVGYPAGANLYEAMQSNPINHQDPSGNVVIGINGFSFFGLGGDEDEIYSLIDRIVKQIDREFNDEFGYKHEPSFHLDAEAFWNTGRLDAEARNYRWRQSQWLKKCPGYDPEGFVLFGVSDGAASIYRFVRDGRAATTLKFNETICGQTHAQISFVGMIDMVRTTSYLPFFNTLKYQRLPILRDAALARTDRNYYQEAESPFRPSCLIGVARGYEIAGFPSGGQPDLIPQTNHCGIADHTKLRDDLVRDAVRAYKEHMEALKLARGG